MGALGRDDAVRAAKTEGCKAILPAIDKAKGRA
jgi:hypothetical protein